MPSKVVSAQIALALVILKSQPDGMSLEEYFERLRNCIKPRSILPEEREHFDTVSFWKQAYEKSEAAQATLLDRIYELEQNQNAPTNEAILREGAASPVDSNKRKRKNEYTAMANSQSKRRTVLAKAPQPSKSVIGDLPTIGKANELQEVHDCSTTFLRHFFNLHQQIVSKRPDAYALHQVLQDLCRISAALISNSTQEDFPPRQSRNSSTQASTVSLQSTALAIQKSYPSILLGLDKLCAKSHGTGEVGSIVYEVILLFEATLAKVSALSVQTAKTTTDTSKPKAKTASSKSRAPNSSQNPPLHHHQAIIQSLAHLAVTMLTTIDPSKKSHAEIIEGCLCAFLDHLGSSLSVAVFSTDDQSSEQQGLFPGVLPAQGLQDMSDLDPKTAIRAVQLEAPYLISILAKVMSFVHGHQETMSSHHSASLLSLSREKLQNTLLKGVFGEDDETFRNALQRPVVQLKGGVEGDLPTRLDQAETPEWFTGEVWRILGWDILAGDDA